jgi:hypothetical protein
MIYRISPISPGLAKDRTLMTRITRMTPIQPIITTHHDVVADIVDIFIIAFSWFHVKVFE